VQGCRGVTAVEVGLVSHLVVRVAVGIDGAVELLEGHQRGDQFVVGVEEGAEPLLGIDVVDL
jgi:hypothetical protein